MSEVVSSTTTSTRHSLHTNYMNSGIYMILPALYIRVFLLHKWKLDYVTLHWKLDYVTLHWKLDYITHCIFLQPYDQIVMLH